MGITNSLKISTEFIAYLAALITLLMVLLFYGKQIVNWVIMKIFEFLIEKNVMNF